MLKKFGIALSVASLGLTGVFADECDPCYCGGFTAGISMARLHQDTMTFLTFGYIDEDFLIDVGGNYQHLKHDRGSSSSSSDVFDTTTFGNSRSRNIGTFLGHVGLRAQVYQDIYFTYGVQGSVSTKEFNDHNNNGVGGRHHNNNVPYTVGAFGGLDIQLNDHYLLTGKIYAFSYQRNGDNSGSSNRNIKYSVFESGVLGIAYVF